MVKMSAAVMQDGETTVIASEYETKSAFLKDLRANGYTVIGRVTVEGEENAKTRRYDRGCRA